MKSRLCMYVYFSEYFNLYFNSDAKQNHLLVSVTQLNQVVFFAHILNGQTLAIQRVLIKTLQRVGKSCLPFFGICNFLKISLTILKYFFQFCSSIVNKHRVTPFFEKNSWLIFFKNDGF